MKGRLWQWYNGISSRDSLCSDSLGNDKMEITKENKLTRDLTAHHSEEMIEIIKSVPRIWNNFKPVHFIFLKREIDIF